MAGFFDFTRAIVRMPGHSVIKGLRDGSGADPDYDALYKEHAGYVAALRGVGVAVDLLEPAEDYPDSIFVEDAALVFGNGAILLRPGAPSRAGEAALLSPVLDRHFSTVLELEEGHVDGGDILVSPDAVIIGLSHRTDRIGAEALMALLSSLGRRTIIAQTPTSILHFKTGCGMIDEETIITTPGMRDCPAFGGLRLVTTPDGEAGAANILRIGNRVLIGEQWVRTRDLIEKLGIETAPLPVDEIAKLDAGLSCMSLRWQAC